jgi:hypothetical protein
MNLEDLYSRIPAMVCKEGCTDCCGPVVFNREELSRLNSKDRGKCNTVSGDCPHSLNGGCDVYENRPFVCRIFGTAKDVPGLECPHGCKPMFPLPGEVAKDLTKNYMTLED